MRRTGEKTPKLKSNKKHPISTPERKKNEKSLTELCDNSNRSNKSVFSVPKEEKENRAEKVLEEIMAENVPNLSKDVSL